MNHICQSILSAGTLITGKNRATQAHKNNILIVNIKEDEMGRACSTNGGDEECI
jgi:hypothetical protein